MHLQASVSYCGNNDQLQWDYFYNDFKIEKVSLGKICFKRGFYASIGNTGCILPRCQGTILIYVHLNTHETKV